MNDYVVVNNNQQQTFLAIGNEIVIPLSALSEIVDNHGDILLYIDDEQYSGYILYRPLQESESFSIRQYINRDGSFRNASSTIRTGFINVEGAREFVYTGFVDNPAHPQLYAYDSNYNPVRILINGNVLCNDRHIIYDGSYKYIVGSSYKDEEYSLVVYFRNRGHA